MVHTDTRAVGAGISRSPPMLIADHPALDFLNSTARPQGEPVEWLRDWADLLDWLEAAKVLSAAQVAAARAVSVADGDRVAAEARKLRDWLGGFVAAYAGKALGPMPTGLGPLNRLLSRHDSVRRVVPRQSDRQGAVLAWEVEHRATMPELALYVIADAVGDLLTAEDFTLVRRCEGPGCTLVFLDRTKPRSRRWCSMAVCGNRAKAAAHRARARGMLS